LDVERRDPHEALVTAAHGRIEDEGWLLRKCGSRYWAHTVITALHDKSGVLSGFAEVIRDMTERKRAEEQLSHMALHDPLTGLPNRALIFDRLASALAASARRGSTTAFLFVDLDRFKLVNDSLGHDAGDELLIAVSGALRGAVREGDTVGRLGGDEFAVVCPDVAGRREAVAVGNRIREVLQKPFLIADREIVVSSSIGIALTRGGNRRPQRLLEEADAAMYAAKRGGRNLVMSFDVRMRQHVLNRVDMRGELRRALERGELTVVYQPQLDLRSGRIVGAEALVRWRHPERGLLSPDAFIPVAEDVGLIGAIDAYVLAEARRAAEDWNPPTVPNRIVVSVNVSATQFSQPGFVDALSASLGDGGAELSTLCLEITEASLIELGLQTASTLERLKSMGVRLAIDDFGTGYSSLSYLAELPLDVVKVDSSFVQGIVRGSRAHAIVAAICTLGRELDLIVVGEGIETADELAELRALDCDVAQGYYIASPGTRDAFAEVSSHPWRRDSNGALQAR
jgi:diguanylate cyclase (GGDEF)-like protein